MARKDKGYQIDNTHPSGENITLEQYLERINANFDKRIKEPKCDNWTMTREEEKELASEEYVKSTLVGSPYIKKTSFKSGVEWADEHPRKGLVDINKACEYIKEYAPIDYDCDGFVEDFRKAMEE